MTNTTSRAFEQLAEQAAWVAEHGGTLRNYIKRYGDPATPEHCHGDGGRAIYQADIDALSCAIRQVTTA